MTDIVLGADEARVNITYGGQNADLPQPVSRNASTADVHRWVTEALRAGSIPGIPAAPQSETFDGFVVDPLMEPIEGRPFALFVYRPQTKFGGHTDDSALAMNEAAPAAEVMLEAAPAVTTPDTLSAYEDILGAISGVEETINAEQRKASALEALNRAAWAIGEVAGFEDRARRIGGSVIARRKKKAVARPPRSVNEHYVALLRSALAEAEAGKVVAGVIVSLRPSSFGDDDVGTASGWVLPGGPGNAQIYLGLVQVQHQISSNLDDK